MLFPGVDAKAQPIFVGIFLGILLTVGAIALIGIRQPDQLVVLATPTPTKTPTRPASPTSVPPTQTATASPTASQTASPTPPPTMTASSTPSPSPTQTSSPTPLPATPTATATATAGPEVVAVTTAITPTEAISPTATLVLTATASLTVPQTVAPAEPPPPTATPVPRTVLVPADIPDYRQVEDHLWFTRPFTRAYNTWGSYYYPYGTNGGGQYFWHYGIDIENQHGTPIVAIGEGTVIHAGPDDAANLLGPWPDFYGQAVVIQHSQRWQGQPVFSLYGHVSRLWVQEGQPVKAGQIIAEVGQLGVALGPHLHLEVRQGALKYSDVRNPDLWLIPDPGFGVIAGRVVDYQGYFVPQQLVTLHRVSDPSRFWRQTFTYPDREVPAGDAWGETFVFSDVPAGSYLLKTFFDGRQLTVPITVTNRSTSFVLMEQSQPPPLPKPPTPTPGPVEAGDAPPPSPTPGG